MSQIPRSFKIIKEENVPVRMRDGVTLARGCLPA